MKSPISATRDVPWLALSVAFHAVVLALLYFFTPLGELVRPGRPESLRPDAVSREHLQTVQRQLTVRAEDKLRQKVSDLAQIDHTMEQIKRTKDAAYAEMAGQFADNAVQAALADMQEALAFQQEALQQQAQQQEALSDALKEVDRFLKGASAFDPKRRPEDLLNEAEDENP